MEGSTGKESIRSRGKKCCEVEKKCYRRAGMSRRGFVVKQPTDTETEKDDDMEYS
jgi:hypothetical protein